MILTSKKSLGPDIQLKILNQVKGTKDKIRIIQAKDAHYQQKTKKI